MHRIEIDDEVYKFLEHRARGFQRPNDVLRSMLLEGEPGAEGVSSRRPGKLVGLLAQGLISPGDRLVHVQVRKGGHFLGVVTEDGWIQTEIDSYAEPSPALRDLVRSQIDGWANWTHERSQKSLRNLRSAANPSN